MDSKNHRLRVRLFSRVSLKGINIRKLASFARDSAAAVSLTGEMNIIVAGSKYIRNLNRKFFGRRESTDVISFSYDAEVLDGWKRISEIYINWDEAKRFAGNDFSSVAKEIAFLIAHGVLHISGMDDKTKEQKSKMLSLGEKFVEKFYR